MSEEMELRNKQELMTMIGHSLEVLEDGLVSGANRQSIRHGILETISNLLDQVTNLTAEHEKDHTRVLQIQLSEKGRLIKRAERAEAERNDLDRALTAQRQHEEARQAEVNQSRARAEKAEAALEEAQKFHPRAMKLIGKRKNFVVVAEDEDYYANVYLTIRIHEKAAGRWTDEDEQKFMRAWQANYAHKAKDGEG